jgi:hypothetical protein
MKLFGKKINKKPSKWHNTPCEYNGIKFDSHKERDRYIFLKSLEDKGVISDLKRQVRYTVCPAVYGEREVQLKTKTKIEKYTRQIASYYYADFTYVLNGEIVVEDVKGAQGTETEVFRLKQKLMLAYNGIEVKKVYNPTEWNHVNSNKKPR